MTTRRSLVTRVAGAIALLVLAAGCAKSSPSSAGSSNTGANAANAAGSPGGSAMSGTATPTSNSSAPGGGSPSQADSTPAQEGTGAESPQPAQQGSPTISLASLPVGGETDRDGARQCAHVGLHTPLPKGTSISITAIGLSRGGIFTLGGDLCAPDSTPCTTAWTWTTDTVDSECAVAVTQVSESEEPVTLVVHATAQCPDQSACDDVQRSLGANGSKLTFTPLPGVVPGSSSSSPAAATPGSSSPETSAATGASTGGS